MELRLRILVQLPFIVVGFLSSPARSFDRSVDVTKIPSPFALLKTAANGCPAGYSKEAALGSIYAGADGRNFSDGPGDFLICSIPFDEQPLLTLRTAAHDCPAGYSRIAFLGAVYGWADGTEYGNGPQNWSLCSQKWGNDDLVVLKDALFDCPLHYERLAFIGSMHAIASGHSFSDGPQNWSLCSLKPETTRPRFFESGVIWEPATHCEEKSFGRWYGCEALPGLSSVNLLPVMITASSLPELKSLPIANQITYQFNCGATIPSNVWFSSNFSDFPLLWNTTGKFQQNYHLSEQSKIIYSLNYPAPMASIGMEDGCKISVLANTSLPDVEVLSTIVDLVKNITSGLFRLKTSIARASDLPAKWAALRAAPKNIDGITGTIEDEIAAFQSELETLKGSSTGSLSDADKHRLEDLPGIIEQYSGLIHDLGNLKSDLGDVAVIASQCEEKPDDAYCLDQVTRISSMIDSAVDQQKSLLGELNRFIAAESARLQTSSRGISEKLKQLIISVE